MAEITTLFWDIGGVLLTNGWDHAERQRAVSRFDLDLEEFEARHRKVAAAFETREITLDEYLAATVFYRGRPFSPVEFGRFMAGQSQALEQGLRLLQEVAAPGRYLIGSINNESLELNLYRIHRFHLARLMSVFVSSCYVGVRKPQREIYCRALELTGRHAGECVMIDDRPENLEAPRALGMHAIRHESAAQVRAELVRLGVETGRISAHS